MTIWRCRRAMRECCGRSRETGAGKIEHVVFIVQENRSFNNLFMDYPGAYTVSSGKDSKGGTIALQPVSLSKEYTIDHSTIAMFAACDGKGSAAGDEVPDGRLRQRVCRRNEIEAPAVRLRSAQRVETVLGYGARVGARRPYVPIAARRELRRAPIYHRRASAIGRESAERSVGLPAGTEQLRRHDQRRSH